MPGCWRREKCVPCKCRIFTLQTHCQVTSTCRNTQLLEHEAWAHLHCLCLTNVPWPAVSFSMLLCAWSRSDVAIDQKTSVNPKNEKFCETFRSFKSWTVNRGQYCPAYFISLISHDCLVHCETVRWSLHHTSVHSARKASVNVMKYLRGTEGLLQKADMIGTLSASKTAGCWKNFEICSSLAAILNYPGSNYFGSTHSWSTALVGCHHFLWPVSKTAFLPALLLPQSCSRSWTKFGMSIFASDCTMPGFASKSVKVKYKSNRKKKKTLTNSSCLFSAECLGHHTSEMCYFLDYFTCVPAISLREWTYLCLRECAFLCIKKKCT